MQERVDSLVRTSRAFRFASVYHRGKLRSMDGTSAELTAQLRQLHDLLLAEARRRRKADALLRELLSNGREVLSPGLPFPGEDGSRNFRGTKGTDFALDPSNGGTSRIVLRSGESMEIPTSDLEEWFVAELKGIVFGPILSLPPGEFLGRLTRAVHGMFATGDEE